MLATIRTVKGLGSNVIAVFRDAAGAYWDKVAEVFVEGWTYDGMYTLAETDDIDGVTSRYSAAITAPPGAAVIEYLDFNTLSVIGTERLPLLADVYVGSGPGSELLTVTMLDADDAPVEGAAVYAHNASGALAGRGTTNASGVAVLNPGTGVIVVTGYYPGCVIPSTSTTVSEGVNQTAALTATPASTPAAADPAECTLYATLRNLDGTPKAGVTGTVNVASLPQPVSGSYFVSQSISATSGADGVISWTVPRGATVVVEIFSALNRRITVPDQASFDFGA